jgi:aspartate carbamoyltransferase catalytic subunit
MKKEVLDKNGMVYEETESLEDVIGQLDVLYMTRIQQERFDRNEDYERLKDSYILTPEKMKLAKDSMCVLHPLPRVNEISVKVDSDPRAAYFRQVLNGKFMRKALILKLLEEANEDTVQSRDSQVIVGNLHCTNPRCITSTEQELSHKFKLVNPQTKECRCLYCEAKKYL